MKWLTSLFSKKKENSVSYTRYHALRELELMGLKPVDQLPKGDPDRWMQESILQLIDVFSAQGHSGSSASYCIEMFSRLARHEIISPLTGEDDEWLNVGSPVVTVYQNKRCGHVFKGEDGQAYDINGKVFRDKDGCGYTNHESRVDIVFPYMPVTEYIAVEEDS